MMMTSRVGGPIVGFTTVTLRAQRCVSFFLRRSWFPLCLCDERSRRPQAVALRLTAVVLAPLCIWLMISIVSITSLGYDAVTLWIKKPINAVLLLVFILALFHHTQLGVQVVIEDYVSSEGQKLTCIVLVKFLALFAGLASILAVLTVFLGL